MSTRLLPKTLLLICSLIILFNVSCQHQQPKAPEKKEIYEIKVDKAGRTLRINKETGDTEFLIGNVWQKIKTEEEARAEQENTRKWNDRANHKQWNLREIEKLKTTAALITWWKDGKLNYFFEFLPLPENIGSVTLLFLDQDGSQFFNYKIEPSNLRYVLNRDGEPSALASQGSFACTMENYDRAKGWDLTWTIDAFEDWERIAKEKTDNEEFEKAYKNAKEKADGIGK